MFFFVASDNYGSDCLQTWYRDILTKEHVIDMKLGKVILYIGSSMLLPSLKAISCVVGPATKKHVIGENIGAVLHHTA